jgi:AcrR family transcriptional regulator
MPSPQRRRHEASPAPRLSKAERRRQLLGRARELFAALGYNATSTQQIAAAAGVTEAVLHRHFPTKQALFVDILEEIRAATVQRWTTEAEALADPLAKLHAIVEMYLGSARVHVVEFQILHRALVETDEEDVIALLKSFYLDSETLLARIISEGQQSGVFRRSLDPRIGAWELIRTALGYTLTLPLGIPLYAEADYLPRAIDCLLHCLLKTDV